MIDCNKDLIDALSTILPTHYEMFLHSGLDTPCISYMELTNKADKEGDTLGYSRITYQVKVWGNDIEEIKQYAQQVDSKLRLLGLTRINGVELYDAQSTMLQYIMTFEGLGFEEFTNGGN